jgi:hypothetical protein
MCRGIDCVLVCPRLRCCCCCTCCTCTHSTIDPSSRTMGDLTLGSRDPGQAKGPILSVSRDMIRETMSLCVLAKRKKGSWFGYFAHEASGGSKSCTRPMDGRSCLRTIRNGARCTWSKLFLGVRMHYIHTVQYSSIQYIHPMRIGQHCTLKLVLSCRSCPPGLLPVVCESWTWPILILTSAMRRGRR